jgi:predicted RNase H-like HicB family nuclease
MEKNLDYYLNLDWTLIEGEDLDFNGNPYHYIEIKEIPSFAFCAKTAEQAMANYKKQLKLVLMVMLENGDDMPEPGDDDEDIDWESICP